MMMRWMFLFVLMSMMLGRAHAQTPERPLILPMADPPGADTWLLGQPYGSTVGAFNFGTQWYSAGQGLHFGVDYSAPCGTPLVAIADGEVAYVDNFSFGSRPHNLILRHPDLGFTSLYGHLARTPELVPGQPVSQGQIVAYSGDPDGTCESRPHLHFELRTLDYRTALNPVPHTDANWHSLALIGGFSYPFFQQDLDNARRWMTLDDQPPVTFGGVRLNAYSTSWPLASGNRPPDGAPLARELPALESSASAVLRRIGYDQCCLTRWWHPTDPDTLYMIDGLDGQRAAVFRWSAQQGAPVTVEDTALPRLTSPDGSHEVLYNAQPIGIRRLSDGATWPLATDGRVPVINADSSRLLWVQQPGLVVPGQQPPQAQVWVSDITGANARAVYTASGANASWLDAQRLLITVSNRPYTTYLVYDLRDESLFELGTFYRPRGLSIAPGGGRLAFYLPFQPDPALNGLYVLETVAGAVPQRLPWFGAFRWRDADSLFYVPYDPTTEAQRLMAYDLSSATQQPLTDPASTPFTIMDGEWDVSADGRSIVFRNAVDRNVWLLELVD